MTDVDWFIWWKRWKQCDHDAWRIETNRMWELNQMFNAGEMTDPFLEEAKKIVRGIRSREQKKQFERDTGTDANWMP